MWESFRPWQEWWTYNVERRTAGRPTSRDPAGCLLLEGRQLLESTKRWEHFTGSVTQQRVALFIITDRIRSTTGRLCFDSCLSICLSTPGGYPGKVRGGGTRVPPQPGQRGGTPAGGYPNRAGVPHLVSTSYAAVGIPHAFTQENFLVHVDVIIF